MSSMDTYFERYDNLIRILSGTDLNHAISRHKDISDKLKEYPGVLAGLNAYMTKIDKLCTVDYIHIPSSVDILDRYEYTLNKLKPPSPGTMQILSDALKQYSRLAAMLPDSSSATINGSISIGTGRWNLLPVNLQLFDQPTTKDCTGEDDYGEEYVAEEVVDTLFSAFDLAQEIMPSESSGVKAISIPVPKKLTLSDAINLVVLLFTILSIYIGSKPDPQLERLIELQEQEIEVLQEDNEKHNATIAQLNETLQLLSDQLESITENLEDDDCTTCISEDDGTDNS